MKSHPKTEDRSQKKTDDLWEDYEDPDIQLDYECGSSDNEDDEELVSHDDKRHGEEKGTGCIKTKEKTEMDGLLLGRTVRKATAPVLPGTQKKPETSKNTNSVMTSDANSETENNQVITDHKSIQTEFGKDEDPSTSKESSEDKVRLRRKIGLMFDREETGQKKRQRITLTEDGEVSYESAVTCPVNRNMVPVEFRLDEFVEDGLVRVSDTVFQYQSQEDLKSS